jgi:predicted nucleotidyltransferase
MSTLAKDKNDILNILKANRDQLSEFGIKQIGLFGSFVRGQQRDASDIDFLVEFEASEKTFDNFIGLSFFLEDLFDQKVEIVTKESLSPYIGPHILNEIEYVTFAA